MLYLCLLFGLGLCLQLLSQQNYIKNGHFEDHGKQIGWKYQSINGIPGWSGNCQIGQSLQYNKVWKPISYVMQLDALYNTLVCQKISLISGQYLLRFKWASYKWDLLTSQGKLYWNNRQLQYIRPTDANLHFSRIYVKAIKGINNLCFQGFGKSDGKGLTIDDITLHKVNTNKYYRIKNNANSLTQQKKQQLSKKIQQKKKSMKKQNNKIINGNFEYPQVKTYNYFSSLIGWQGTYVKLMKSKQQKWINKGAMWWCGRILKLVHGNLLNPVWNQQHGQVIDLDIQMNQKIQQEILIYEQGSFVLTFQWAQSNTSQLRTNTLAIYLNDQLMQKFIAEDYQLHQYVLPLYIYSGNCKISLEGGGIEDGQGIAIDNIILTKNYIVNGEFQIERIGDWPKVMQITSWCCNIKIGLGKFLNSNFKSNTQVVELDSYKNTKITQQIRLEQGKYILGFKWAINQNASQDSSDGKIYWNSKIIKKIHPNNNEIQIESIRIIGRNGINILEFQGDGISDGLGLLIDNISIRIQF